MVGTSPDGTRIGWMGAALVRRLLAAGYDVAVYNRTRVLGTAKRHTISTAMPAIETTRHEPLTLWAK